MAVMLEVKRDRDEGLCHTNPTPRFWSCIFSSPREGSHNQPRASPGIELGVALPCKGQNRSLRTWGLASRAFEAESLVAQRVAALSGLDRFGSRSGPQGVALGAVSTPSGRTPKWCERLRGGCNVSRLQGRSSCGSCLQC